MGVRLIGAAPKRLTPARRRLIDILSDGLLHGKSEAAREAGVSAGVIDGLVDEGTLTVEPMPRALAPPAPDPSFAEPDFSSQQRTAVDAMRALAANGSFHVALLDGVTGSGKTEVYFEAIAGSDPARKADADPDAGDRADRPVPRPLCRAFRGAAAGVAFRTDPAHPATQLGRDRGGRSAGGGGRALRAVSALRQSRADHRR